MGNQRPAGKMQGQQSHARVVGDARYGSRRIDERDIPLGESHALIVLVDRRVTCELKHGLVVVQIVHANLRVAALESVRTTTDVHSLETAQAEGAQPSGEGLWIPVHQGVPPTKRAD